VVESLKEMEKYLEKERNISTDDILKTLDCFGSKTPSPVEDDRGGSWQIKLNILIQALL